jgi:hypothetical protein
MYLCTYVLTELAVLTVLTVLTVLSALTVLAVLTTVLTVYLPSTVLTCLPLLPLLSVRIFSRREPGRAHRRVAFLSLPLSVSPKPRPEACLRPCSPK